MKFGFVTFKSAKDAYNTIDGSASDPALNAYDISFGGRRAFCKESYLDLGKGKLETNKRKNCSKIKLQISFQIIQTYISKGMCYRLTQNTIALKICSEKLN